MILHLNTTKLERIEFKLLDGKKTIAEDTVALEYHENGDILKHLEAFLRKQKVKSLASGSKNLQPTTYNLITGIRVSAGTGSYTGIRVGTSIAQALSLAWNVPLKIKST